jgi:FkbM family methyltransferase
MQDEKLFQEAQLMHQRGQLTDALVRYERALKINPKNSAAHIFRALVLQQNGKPSEALEAAEKAIKTMGKPNLAVLVNYGVILKNAGRLDDAANAYEQALEINSNLLSAKSNLATIYFIQGKIEIAEKIFIELTDKMKEPAPWLNLARISILKNKYEQASEYLQHAEDYDLTHPDCTLIRGRLASLDKDFNEAYNYCIIGLKRSPAHRDTWMLLQSIDSSYYKEEEIEACLMSLTNIEVNSATVLSIGVDISRKLWLWDSLEELELMLSKALIKSIDKVPTMSDVFTLLGANISQNAHLSAAKKCWQGLTANIIKDKNKRHLNIKNHSKIRVGFLSSDLRGHAIGFLIVGLIEKLPKEQIEWWAYNNAIADSDVLNDRLRKNFDRFINIAKLNDEELAEKIIADKIDVLIDLNQMTSMTRVAVMARRPAPIQIQWLGMPGSLGAGSDVDFILVDQWAISDINIEGFDEKLIVLPRSYQPNDDVKPNLSLCISRAAAGLPDNGKIIGVFNQFYKFSPDTLKLWGDIYKAVPEVYFWLLAPKNNDLKNRILQTAEKVGIPKNRIIFASHAKQEEHLARLQWMDLVLDTWPYNAHTTCSDALRVGVPVLTLPKSTFASRVAMGILMTAKFNEWVSSSESDYLKKAISYISKDRDELDLIKADIYQRYWSGQMPDNLAFANLFEIMIIQLCNKWSPEVSWSSFKFSDKLELISLEDGYKESYLTGVNNINAAVDVDTKLKFNDKPTNKGSHDWIQDIKRGSKISRSINQLILKEKIIELNEDVIIADIGAAYHSWDPMIYDQAVDSGLVKLIGFEPELKSFQKLEAMNRPNRKYYNMAIADGYDANLFICSGTHMSSLLEPNTTLLNMFGYKSGEVVKKININTFKLIDIPEMYHASFIKIDTQGTELNIIKNAYQLLDNLCFIQTEAAFFKIHHNQPSFFDIGKWFEENGFVLHLLAKEQKVTYFSYGTTLNQVNKQLLEVDAVFMPNPALWPSFSSHKLTRLALLAHIIYRSFDITFMALTELDLRDGGSRVESYRLYLEHAGLDA